MKIDIRLFAIGLMILGCFAVPATATHFPCPDCRSGSECDWDCAGGESCCDGDCCGDDCCNDNCLDCGSGDCCGSSCCDNTCCDGECCSAGECCDSGSCESPDTSWTVTATISTTVDQSVLNKVNSAINSIPGISGTSVDKIEGALSAKRRECCDPDGDIKHETCCDGTLTLEAEVEKIKIWGPPQFEESVSFGAFWGANVKITVGVFIQGTISASGTYGKYVNECDQGCDYGSASIGGSVALIVEATGCCCVKTFGTDHCTGTIGVTGSGSISWDGTFRNNQCGSCDGPNGDINLNDITCSLTVDIGVWSAGVSKQIYP